METSQGALPHISRRIGCRAAALIVLAISGGAVAHAQTTQYFAGDGSALTASKYSNSPTGPTFTSAFVSGNILGFGVANGTGTGAVGLTIGGINATENFTYTAPSGTLATGGTVVGISVADGKTLNLGSVSLSTAAGTGFIKNGNGVFFSSNANAYTGGFTLNAGTVVVGGVNALGGGTGNTLTLNGGIIAGSATRDLSGKYTNGITIGGDVQFGDVTGLASTTGNLTFSNNMTLGGVSRILTLGNGGNVAFGGVIANTGSSGLIFAANVNGTGRFDVTNTGNTFTGTINVTGGEVRFTADGSFGNAANNIVVDGGRLATLSGATYTLSAARGIQVGSTAGTSISTPGAGALTYNGVIADKMGNAGILVKQGGGTLALGGVSTYSGDTSINNGILQLTTADNRLPTGTTVDIGQSASANLGTLNLNGLGQQIAGLNSTSGTNVSATLKNTVTSTTAATLTLGGSGTYLYGDGTAANSGIITGAVAINKTGSGMQTFGDANTYTGATSISGGILKLANATGVALSATAQININAGGTLLMGAVNQLNATTPAPVVLSGAAGVGSAATVKVGGFNQGSTTAAGVGALTLATGSVNNAIDFGVAAGVISFSGLTTNGATLTINGYLGNGGAAGGQDQLIFNQDQIGNLNNIVFTGYGAASEQLVSGMAGSGNAFYEVFPASVPEPTTFLGGALILVAWGWNQRRRTKAVA